MMQMYCFLFHRKSKDRMLHSWGLAFVQFVLCFIYCLISLFFKSFCFVWDFSWYVSDINLCLQCPLKCKKELNLYFVKLEEVIQPWWIGGRAVV